MYAILLIVALLLAIPVAALYVARRRTTLGNVFFVAGTTVFGTWLVFFILSVADYRDADGWIDCGDACTTLQLATSGVLFGGLAVLGLLAALSVLIPIAARLRPPQQ